MWKFCPAWASGSVVCGGRVDMWRLRIACWCGEGWMDTVSPAPHRSIGRSWQLVVPTNKGATCLLWNMPKDFQVIL